MDFQKKYGKILLPLITPYDENERSTMASMPS